MILFTILFVISLILAAIVIAVVSAIGAAGIVVFGDVIVCIGIIAAIMYAIIKSKRNRRGF